MPLAFHAFCLFASHCFWCADITAAMRAGKIYLFLGVWNNTDLAALRTFNPLAAVHVVDTNFLVTVFASKCDHPNTPAA